MKLLRVKLRILRNNNKTKGTLQRLVARVLQIRVTAAGGCITALVLVLFTLGKLLDENRPTTRYVALPLSDIDHELYRQVNPNLRKTKPDCDFQEIIHRKKTLYPNQFPSKIDEFTTKGLSNGSYSPPHCNPLISVAILVTYRNREKQLSLFLLYMHNFLRKQNIHYKIYVIEQEDNKPWNKGLLYNVGVRHAMADNFPCLILHDVDVLPLDEANLYACFSMPRHLSAAVDRLRYVLISPGLVGGVLAIRSDQYTKVNGFSNMYLRWGGEDDDFYFRLKDEGFEILRLPIEVSRYHMIYHAQAEINPEALTQLKNARKAGRTLRDLDGLRSASYSHLKLSSQPLFTLVQVQL